MNLQPYPIEQGCFRKFSIVHEFLHALGFFHMQSASDRDQYVQIVWDKIQTDKYENFMTNFDGIILLILLIKVSQF